MEKMNRTSHRIWTECSLGLLRGQKMLLLAALLLVGARFVHAQIDTQFWFAVPQIVDEHMPNDVFLQVVAYDDDATITISQPAQGRTLLKSRVVQKHTTYQFPLRNVSNYRTTVATQADGEVHETGILVESTAKVTVYFAATDPNSEVYTLKGRHGLGTEFVVPMQFRHACGHNAYGSIEIVATADQTTVQIQTLVPTNALPTAGTVTIRLNKGETYALRTLTPNTAANKLLGGTVVTSDKPIAVNSTDDSAAAGGDLDMIGEQLVPTTLAGSHYIVPANNSAGHEYVYLFAIGGPQQVYTTDATGAETLAANIAPGTPAEVRLNQLQARLFYTKDNSPFVCFHLTANENGNELSGTVLPSLNCSGSQEVCYVPALSAVEAYVTILTRTENIDAFTVNGSPYELPDMAFFPVPGDSTWSYCASYNLTLGGGATAFDIRNTKGVFHLGILDSGGGACSYGFFSNFGEISLYASPAQDYYFAGDTLRLHLTGAGELENIRWTGPNGWTSTAADPIIVGANELNSGVYTVTADHKEGCEVQPDTTFVAVFSAVPYSKDTLCLEDSIRYAASLSKPLTWYVDGEEQAGHSSRFFTYLADADVRAGQLTSIRVEGYKTGANMIQWSDSAELVLHEADSVIAKEYRFDNLILGAEYEWTVRLRATEPNTVAPKVRLRVNDALSGIVAVPNSGTVKATYRWTATDRQVRLRVEVVSAKPERHLMIADMQLVPSLAFTETHDVVAKDCSESEPEPDPEPDDCQYDMIRQRWNDVLFVLNSQYNGGMEFVAYQWVRNGETLEGATKSYLYVEEGLHAADTYTCELTLTDGSRITTCPYMPEVYPMAAAPERQEAPRYYDASGQEVFEPLQTGFYIRVQGEQVDKIVR